MDRNPMGAEPTSTALRPTRAAQREPILDVLRGFALLGILIINIELMRGADFYRLVGGEPVAAGGAADRVVHFLSGWLVAGKFLSSFAILFGIGAALIAMRAWRAGRSPRRLLARRYGVLLLFGVAHMVLLFPGDILFAYGLAGMVLLAFVGVRARTALWWTIGILTVQLLIGLGVTAFAPDAPADDPVAAGVARFVERHAEQTLTAYQDGGYGAVVAANAWQSLLIQPSTLLLLPWVVALFLLGFAVGASGLLADLPAHRRGLRTAMVTGLAVGLPLNLPAGFVGPLSVGGVAPGGDVGALLAVAGQVVGAPALAVGYLSALALLCLRRGPMRRLAATGRMALTAYVLQSALALLVFAGFGLYDRLTPAQALLVVVAIWVVLLVACPLWMRHFRFGPLEWLWRTLTYGQRQPLRAG
ncbi:MAG: DUF418 domain-containing protein [Egibacteraceae bacterium]